LPSNFYFFAGKGGVGKTTCAAAAAVASAAAGRRVLIVSTDPAHSVGDVLAVSLDSGSSKSSKPSDPRRIPLRKKSHGSLHAAEIDAKRAFGRWLRAHSRALGDIIEHGTWLDRADVDALLDLAIPGIDELVGLDEIVRLSRLRDYDEVVVDAAPTGHTLRLLASPETVTAVARALDALQEEHRLIRDQLTRVGRGPEPADRLIELLAAQAEETARLLRDPRRTTITWVALPEEMSLAETTDGLAALERSQIHVGSLIVNRVTPAGPPCPVCDRRRLGEQRVIGRVRQRLGRGRDISIVPAQTSEPRGVEALRRIRLKAPNERAIRLKPDPTSDRGIQLKRDPPNDRRIRFSIPGDARTVALESLDVFRGARLLFVGGKGGVGKTTIAAAAALRLARAEPRRAVLLLSTDPAHSLADVFHQPAGDEPLPIRGAPPNLHVRELDAAAAFASRRARLQAALNEIGSGFGAGVVSGGRSAAELMEMAPPGIDELFGFVSVADAREHYPLVVVDTAPTGHALRLLETPETARQWVQVLLRMLIKYRELVRPGQLATELVDLSKSIRQLQALLRNARDTRFIVVMRAARVPRLETERLIRRLRRMRLAAPAVVVNAMTLSPERCPICRANATAERRELAALERQKLPCVIIQTPLAVPPPRGPAALDRWAGSWMRGGHAQKPQRPQSSQR
jgi:arsenite/tail-anchored protein-transporting ATPase